MPTYDEFDLTGMQIEASQWTGAVLRSNFGGGYGAIALVDNAAGLHLWTLRQAQMPGNSLLPMGGQPSRFDYYWEFFKAHTTGSTEIFIITWRGKSYHASFADPSMTFTQLCFKLNDPEWFTSGGLKVNQRRVSGFTYNDDGSLPGPDVTPPTVPTGLDVTFGEGTIDASWDASTD